MKNLEFTTTLTNEFGIGTDTRKANIGFDAEETFLNCLNKLPKRISKAWESIEFTFMGTKMTVCKHHLKETNFDFWNSVTLD